MLWNEFKFSSFDIIFILKKIKPTFNMIYYSIKYLLQHNYFMCASTKQANHSKPRNNCKQHQQQQQQRLATNVNAINADSITSPDLQGLCVRVLVYMYGNGYVYS